MILIGLTIIKSSRSCMLYKSPTVYAKTNHDAVLSCLVWYYTYSDGGLCSVVPKWRFIHKKPLAVGTWLCDASIIPERCATMSEPSQLMEAVFKRRAKTAAIKRGSGPRGQS